MSDQAEIHDPAAGEVNRTLLGQRKALYVRDGVRGVKLQASPGLHLEEVVTLQAVDACQRQAELALQRARRGEASPLEYHMYAARLDPLQLAQATGLARWRVRRHLQAGHFASLPDKLLARYAEALGLSLDQLRQIP